MTKQEELIQYLEKEGTIQREFGMIIFRYTNKKTNKASVKVFFGRRTRPSYHYYFGSEEKRELWINDQVQQANKQKANTEERNVKIQKENELLQVGKILVSTWGYDQTNVDFYLIVERKAQTLTLQKVGANRTYSGDMSGDCTPDIESKIGEPFKKRVSKFGGVSFSSFEHAILWDGEKVFFSTWA